MFGLGVGELAVIFGILVVMFGASRLPELGHGIGRGIANFKSAVSLGDEGKGAGPGGRSGVESKVNGRSGLQYGDQSNNEEEAV